MRCISAAAVVLLTGFSLACGALPGGDVDVEVPAPDGADDPVDDEPGDADVPPDRTWKGAKPLPARQTLETAKVKDTDRLGLTRELHVLLQIHGKNGKQSEASTRCGHRMIATMMERADDGHPAVVVEGINLKGSYNEPETERIRGGKSAVERMTTLPRLKVYGFESKAIQPRSTLMLDRMKDARDDIKELSRNRESYDDPLARLDEIKQVMVPANTEFVAAGMPLRSFQAIQTAMAVMDARQDNSVAIVIGRAHWSDFPHMVREVDRLGNETFIGLRVIKYECTK